MMAEMHEEFPRTWRAELLDRPPLIAPAAQYVYPRQVPGEEETLARGALQALIAPADGASFLATFALGFSDRRLPSGIWTCPAPHEICALAGGYGYVVDTRNPAISHFLPLRPIVQVLPIVTLGLLVFAGLNELSAWGVDGQAWTTSRLSWEGVTIGPIEGDELDGLGWDMRTDREIPFRVDLRTGSHTGGGFKPEQ